MGLGIIGFHWRGRLQLSVHHFLISFDYVCILSNTLLGCTVRNTTLLSLWTLHIISHLHRSLWISPLGCHSILAAHYGHHSHFFLFSNFNFFNLYFTLEYSWFTTLLCSGVQQNNSIIHIRISILFQILFPFRLLQNIEQSSLWYTVGPCLSIFFFQLHWVGLRCCVQALCGCGKRGLLFIAVCRLLIVVGSLVAEHRL